MRSASSTKTSSTPARVRCSAALMPERPPPTIRMRKSGVIELQSLVRAWSPSAILRAYTFGVRNLQKAVRKLRVAAAEHGEWTAAASAELYGIRNWGADYF